MKEMQYHGKNIYGLLSAALTSALSLLSVEDILSVAVVSPKTVRQ